jgi:hypothetical protein
MVAAYPELPPKISNPFPFAGHNMRNIWFGATPRQVEVTGTCSLLRKAQNKVPRRICRPLISEKTRPLGSVVNVGNRSPLCSL